MHGDQATRLVILLYQIKRLINEEKYVNVKIIGHSSDDDYINIDNFIKSGADAFERKPTNVKNIKEIISKHVTQKNMLKFYE